MHMNIEMALRLMMTPTTPMVNSTAESARYHESGIIFRPPLLRPSSPLASAARRAEFGRRGSNVSGGREPGRRRSARERDRADERHQDENRSDLEGQKVLG